MTAVFMVCVYGGGGCWAAFESCVGAVGLYIGAVFVVFCCC